MNYQIIADERELQKFVDFLPETTDDEKFYVALFARKKYTDDPRFKSDKAQLKRLMTTKSRLISDLRKLEVKQGWYNFNGLTIPQEMLAVYINPNPRSLHRSSLELMKRFAIKLRDEKTLGNPKSEAMNCLQVTPSRKIYFDIDLDVQPLGRVSLLDVASWIASYDFINVDALTVVETRGGWHVLVELDKIEDKYKKSWYQGFSKGADWLSMDVMMNSDNLLPIPGCFQGGAIPKLVKSTLSI